MLPLKELIRWHKMHKKVKKTNLEDSDAMDHSTTRRIWCWWERDNENGITDETLNVSNTLWEQSAIQWENKQYLEAMAGFQNSLEPYHKA